MKCEDVRELLSDYVSDGMDSALAVSVENHMAGCAGCRQEAAGLKTIWQSLNELAVVETPQYFHENLMTRVNAAINSQEEAVARRRSAWDWRALFKPRALAYAA